MRAWEKTPQTELHARYLGELAPLLVAARRLEALSAVEQRQVRRRILRTLFGFRPGHRRSRLLSALAAVACLIAGGAAFATAQRLGLLPGLGGPQADSSLRTTGTAKHKASRGRSGGAAAVEPASPLVPDTPDPEPANVSPEPARPPLAPSTSGALPRAQAAGATVAAPPAPQPVGRPSRRLVMSGSPAPAASVDRPAPVMPAPPAPPPARVMPRPLAAPVPATPPIALSAAPAPPVPAPVPPAAPAAPPAAPPAPAAVQPPRAAMPAPSLAAPPLAQTPSQTPSPSSASDQGLFGLALRKLRAGHDAAGALAALREHGRAFPRSALAGERQALEIEALLELHRERDALALLDSMALEELPRGGERLVVRGELRATAKRWPEALADFDRALARVSGSPAWHERALWGRGVARLRLGEREAGLADIERYRDSYPRGRFAAQASRLLSSR